MLSKLMSIRRPFFADSQFERAEMKAQRLLGWRAEAYMKDVVAMIVKAELELQGRRASDKRNVDDTGP
jgi:GDP-D-mannose dehydratase